MIGGSIPYRLHLRYPDYVDVRSQVAGTVLSEGVGIPY